MGLLHKLLGALVLLAILAVVIGTLERISPAVRGVRFFRRGRLNDIAHALFGGFVTRPAGKAFSAAIAIVVVLATGAPRRPDQLLDWLHARSPFGHLPFVLQAVAGLLVADLFAYWMHRLQHGRVLWPFHAVHHSSRTLDWLAGARNHPIAEALGQVAVGLPVIALGFDPRIFLVIGPVLGLWALMLHANVSWTFGRARYVFATPLFHRWHHAAYPPRPNGVNFAAIFPLWDLVFGTFYTPLRQPLAYGSADPVPQRFVAQMLYPFRKRRLT